MSSNLSKKLEKSIFEHWDSYKIWWRMCHYPTIFLFIRIYSRFTNLYLLPLSHKFLSYPRALLFIRSWRRFNLTFCSAICYLVPIVHQRNKVLKETKGIVAVVLILIQMATSKNTVWSWMCLLLQSKCVACW